MTMSLSDLLYAVAVVCFGFAVSLFLAGIVSGDKQYALYSGIMGFAGAVIGLFVCRGWLPGMVK